MILLSSLGPPHTPPLRARLQKEEIRWCSQRQVRDPRYQELWSPSDSTLDLGLTYCEPSIPFDSTWSMALWHLELYLSQGTLQTWRSAGGNTGIKCKPSSRLTPHHTTHVSPKTEFEQSTEAVNLRWADIKCKTQTE